MLLAACELEEVAIPATESRVALHGVLSASAQTQVIVLERTRAGLVGIVGPPIDLPDATVNDQGIAESGALVQLTTPSGQTLVAREDSELSGGGRGAGIYRFALAGSALERGGIYRLGVRTTKGEILTAETSVPEGIPAAAAEARGFDRTSEELLIEWPATTGARSYFVRIETPYGPRAFFTDSTHIRLTGSLRNIDIDELPRVFIPGFSQAVTVSAVDSNYYDWYRTHNDIFSGTGLVNRVTGGIGVFGSVVRLRFQELHVVAPQTAPIEGHYEFIGTPAEVASTAYLNLDLYVESPSARSDQGDALSGRCMERPRIGGGETINGVLGTARNGQVELALLDGWFARDTADILLGEIRGDTIVGEYRLNGGRVRFVKR